MRILQEGALLGAATSSLKPGESMLISAGNPHHQHEFDYVDWDRERLGPDVTDVSDDFWSCTFKNLWRCSCGAEKITCVRDFV